MGTQLDLFAPQIEWKVGDLVYGDFRKGLDLIHNIERCFLGGNYGFILKLTQYNTHAIVHFPARIEPDLSYCKDEWFDFQVTELCKVTAYGFDEKAFRETYSPKLYDTNKIQ